MFVLSLKTTMSLLNLTLLVFRLRIFPPAQCSSDVTVVESYTLWPHHRRRHSSQPHPLSTSGISDWATWGVIHFSRHFPVSSLPPANYHPPMKLVSLASMFVCLFLLPIQSVMYHFRLCTLMYGPLLFLAFLEVLFGVIRSPCSLELISQISPPFSSVFLS
jgi:hypothetical protein